MAINMQTAATWLGTKLKTPAGRTVTIRQGTASPKDITASSASDREHDVVDTNGMLTKVITFTWTFVAADLGNLTLRSGAEIVETIGGITSKYEVMSPGKGKDAVEYDDTKQLLYAHTKQVA